MTNTFREELTTDYDEELDIHLTMAQRMTKEELLHELKHVYGLYYKKRIQAKSYHDSLINLGFRDIVEEELGK